MVKICSEDCRNINKWCDHDTVEIFLEKTFQTLSKPLKAKQHIRHREEITACICFEGLKGL